MVNANLLFSFRSMQARVKNETNMRRGALILCGGKSTRMGTAKALLPFGPELMLQRVVRLVGKAVPLSNIVVVAAVGQQLPSLPAGVEIAHDGHENRGPLEGFAAGITALKDRADVVFATSCDVPLLVPAFVDRMFELLGDSEIAVPRDGKFYHPLAAVYRSSVLTHVHQLLATNRLRLSLLFQEVITREVSVDELLAVDHSLLTLRNINCPQDYLDALASEGLKPTAEILRLLAQHLD